MSRILYQGYHAKFSSSNFNDIAILRSIEPNRFRTFLLRFDNDLRSQGFSIPETAEFTDAHLQRLIGIFNAHDGSTPADMIEVLFHISEVSNDQGMEALLLAAPKTGIELPEGDLTPADLDEQFESLAIDDSVTR